MHREGFGELVGPAERGEGRREHVDRESGQGPDTWAGCNRNFFPLGWRRWLENDLRKTCKRYSIYPTCICWILVPHFKLLAPGSLDKTLVALQRYPASIATMAQPQIWVVLSLGSPKPQRAQHSLVHSALLTHVCPSSPSPDEGGSFFLLSQTRRSLFSVKALVTHRCLSHYSCFSSWSVTFPINSPQGIPPCWRVEGSMWMGKGGRVLGDLPWTACNWPLGRLLQELPSFGLKKVTLWPVSAHVPGQVCHLSD